MQQFCVGFNYLDGRLNPSSVILCLDEKSAVQRNNTKFIFNGRLEEIFISFLSRNEYFCIIYFKLSLL